jgi:hypothetical protein
LTFASVGAVISITAATFSLNPTAIGQLFIATVTAYNTSTVHATGITSTNITWAQVGTTFVGVSGVTCSQNMWLGTSTATGAATQTIAFSGTTPQVFGSSHAFSSTVGAWSLDGAQNNVDGNTASAGTLTPTQAGDIFWMHSIEGGSGSAGTTPGYTYFTDTGGGGEGCFNPACANSVQAPTFGASDFRTGIAILVKENVAGGTGLIPQQLRQRRPAVFTRIVTPKRSGVYSR